MQVQLRSGIQPWIALGLIALAMGNAYAGNN